VIEVTELRRSLFHHVGVTYRRTQLSLPAHGAIAIALGMAMLVAPALIGFGVAGLVLSASLGAVEIGFGLTLTAPGRYVTAWRAHLDSLFALATAASALGLAAAGQATAAMFLAAIAGASVCLNLATQYARTS
jgi:hypothetical protein